MDSVREWEMQFTGNADSSYTLQAVLQFCTYLCVEICQRYLNQMVINIYVITLVVV